MKWTKEERRVLWRCFVETGGKKERGYLGKLKERWDRHGLTQRDKESLLIQLRAIQSGSLLSAMERGEIEKEVSDSLPAVDIYGRGRFEVIDTRNV